MMKLYCLFVDVAEMSCELQNWTECRANNTSQHANVDCYDLTEL